MEQPSNGGATGGRKTYEIRVSEEAAFYKYRVTVEVHEDIDVSYDLTDWTRNADDGYQCRQAGMCRDLVQTFFYKSRAEAEDVVVAYDGRKELYTNRRLPGALMKPTTVHGYMMSLHVAQKLIGASATVTLKAENNNDEFKVRGLLTQEGFGSEWAKCELRAFFTCLCDEAALQSGHYTSVGGQLYAEEHFYTEFERGLVIRGGVRRGIRFPDGRDKLEAPLYVADVRNWAFYKDQTMAQSLREVVGQFPSLNKDQILQHFLEVYRGVRCHLTYAPHETLTVEAYGREARDIEIPQPDGAPINMADHFRKKYNVHLADDTVPTVRMAGDTREHPLDVLEILPHQRVQISAMDTDMLNALLSCLINGQNRIEDLNAHIGRHSRTNFRLADGRLRHHDELPDRQCCGEPAGNPTAPTRSDRCDGRRQGDMNRPNRYPCE